MPGISLHEAQDANADCKNPVIYGPCGLAMHVYALCFVLVTVFTLSLGAVAVQFSLGWEEYTVNAIFRWVVLTIAVLSFLIGLISRKPEFLIPLIGLNRLFRVLLWGFALFFVLCAFIPEIFAAPFMGMTWTALFDKDGQVRLELFLASLLFCALSFGLSTVLMLHEMVLFKCYVWMEERSGKVSRLFHLLIKM